MDPDSSSVSRVERTLWAVWNYITEAVNRLLNPEPTSTESNSQDPQQGSADEPSGSHHVADDTTEQGEDEESPHATSSLLGLSRPGVAWDLCTTEINLGPEAGLVSVKAKEDEESDSSGQVETSKDEEHDEGASLSPTDDGEPGAEEALDALSQRVNDAPSTIEEQDELRHDGVSPPAWEDENKDGNRGVIAPCGELNAALRPCGVESEDVGQEDVVGEIDEAEDERDQLMHEERFTKRLVSDEESVQDPEVDDTLVQTNDDGGKVADESADASSKERFSDEDLTEFASEEEDDSKESPTPSVPVQAGREIGSELRSIPPGDGEGHAAVPHSSTSEETREGVPEHNNEPGPDENTTQRFLEGGNCEGPLQEVVASRECSVFQREDRHERVEDTEERTEGRRLGTEEERVELAIEGSGHPVKTGIEDLDEEETQVQVGAREEETDESPDGTQEKLFDADMDEGISGTTDTEEDTDVTLKILKPEMNVFHESAETPEFIKSGLTDPSQGESRISDLQEEVESREFSVFEMELMEERQERVEDHEERAELRTEQETVEPMIQGSGHLVKMGIEDLEVEDTQVGAREEKLQDGTQEMLLDVDMDEGISGTTDAVGDTGDTLKVLEPEMNVFHESAETPGFIKSGLTDQSQGESRISDLQGEMESRELSVLERELMEERQERVEDREERAELRTEQERVEPMIQGSGHLVKTGIEDLEEEEKLQDETQEMLLDVDMDEGISETTDAEEDTDDTLKILKPEMSVVSESAETPGFIKSGFTVQSQEESRISDLSGEEMQDWGTGMEEGDHEVEEQVQNTGSDQNTLLAKPESSGPDEPKDQPSDEESEESDEETLRDQEAAAADETETTERVPPEQPGSDVIDEEILDLWIKTVTLQEVNGTEEEKEEGRPVSEQQEVEPQNEKELPTETPVESREPGLVSDTQLSSGLLDLTGSECGTDHRESCPLMSTQDNSESAVIPELSPPQHEDESQAQAAEEGTSWTEESTQETRVQSSLGVKGGRLNLEWDESQEDTREEQPEENGTGSRAKALFTRVETEDADLEEMESDSEEERRQPGGDSEEVCSRDDNMPTDSEDDEAERLFSEEVVEPNWPETEEESAVESDVDALDFTPQRWRIAVKNPRVRPPTDPRSLLHLPSLDPTPAPRLPVQIPAGVPLGGRGIGIKLPGFGAGFPVLKKTQHVVREEKSSESAPQEPGMKPEEKSDASQQHRPKWMPPKHPGFGNPLMSELKTKLKKTSEE